MRGDGGGVPSRAPGLRGRGRPEVLAGLLCRRGPRRDDLGGYLLRRLALRRPEVREPHVARRPAARLGERAGGDRGRYGLGGDAGRARADRSRRGIAGGAARRSASASGPGKRPSADAPGGLGPRALDGGRRTRLPPARGAGRSGVASAGLRPEGPRARAGGRRFVLGRLCRRDCPALARERRHSRPVPAGARASGGDRAGRTGPRRPPRARPRASRGRKAADDSTGRDPVRGGAERPGAACRRLGYPDGSQWPPAGQGRKGTRVDRPERGPSRGNGLRRDRRPERNPLARDRGRAREDLRPRPPVDSLAPSRPRRHGLHGGAGLRRTSSRGAHGGPFGGAGRRRPASASRRGRGGGLGASSPGRRRGPRGNASGARPRVVRRGAPLPRAAARRARTRLRPRARQGRLGVGDDAERRRPLPVGREGPISARRRPHDRARRGGARRDTRDRGGAGRYGLDRDRREGTPSLRRLPVPQAGRGGRPPVRSLPRRPRLSRWTPRRHGPRALPAREGARQTGGEREPVPGRPVDRFDRRSGRRSLGRDVVRAVPRRRRRHRGTARLGERPRRREHDGRGVPLAAARTAASRSAWRAGCLSSTSGGRAGRLRLRPSRSRA